MLRRLRLILAVLMITILLLAGAFTGYGLVTVRRMLPMENGSLTLAGLNGPVTIYRDTLGIPHIYASSTRDLFFAQGLIHAQDRWWQMEFNRHTGLGRIGELTGNNPHVLESDTFIRTLGWNRAAQANFEVSSKETKDVLQSYADGINGYLEGKSGPDLAVEYSLLAVRGVSIPIEKWEPTHSVAWGFAMAWDLSNRMDVELTRAALYQKFGDKAQDMVDGYLMPPYPFDKRQTIVTDDDLPVKPEPAITRDIPALAPGTDLNGVPLTLVGGISPDWHTDFGKVPGSGSNNWVISGKLTQSGKPLLANDPHIGIGMPSIWYQMGLHCTTLSADCPYDVVGYTFPGVPGVIIGHNQRIAWGVTNVDPDVQDLYVIKVDAKDDTQYELDGKTESMQVITETIKFGDKTPPKELRVRVTKFGPIITDTSAFKDRSDKQLALKWTATATPHDLLGSVLAINRATDWQTFRQGLTKWAVPSQNFVYADVDGNIGYQTPGLVPIREKDHSGILPADGSTSKYDWKGYIPFENLPRIYNPTRGWIVTANEAVVGPKYTEQLAGQIGDKFGKDSNYLIMTNWDYGYRGARIVEMMKGFDKHSIDTMKTIQGDNYNLSAAEILPSVLKLDFGSDVPKDVIEWMGKWDYQEHFSSGPAALYEQFWVELGKRLWGDQLGSTPSGSNIAWGTRLLLDKPDHAWWDDVTTTNKTETRDDILRAAFVAAYQGTVKQLGADYKTWQWGSLHKATFASNPIGASGINILEDFVNIKAVPVSGGQFTINRSNWNSSKPYETTSISSMRLVIDLSNFDNSLWIVPTGSSGHPASNHYRDQNEKWRTAQYNPMLWDQNEIKRVAVTTLTLQPKK